MPPVHCRIGSVVACRVPGPGRGMSDCDIHTVALPSSVRDHVFANHEELPPMASISRPCRCLV